MHEFYSQKMIYLQFVKMIGMGKNYKKKKNRTKENPVWLSSNPLS